MIANVDSAAQAIVESLRESFTEMAQSNEELAKSLGEVIGLTPEVANEMRLWRDNARSRLRKGLTPRQFESNVIPTGLQSIVWKRLEGAESREAIDAAFVLTGGSELCLSRQ